MMESPLYDQIYELSLDIATASVEEDNLSVWSSYSKLRELCERNEPSSFNHPLQWETLGDFTTHNGHAIAIYQKALMLADHLNLLEYKASIQLALAERYLEQDEDDRAYNLVLKANEAAKRTDNLDLRQAISELLLELSAVA